MNTDPQKDGHERFRVSKENFGVSSDTRKIILERLNSLQEWDTTLTDGLDEFEGDGWDEYNETNNETNI
jgi:hypothetical protein